MAHRPRWAWSRRALAASALLLAVGAPGTAGTLAQREVALALEGAQAEVRAGRAVAGSTLATLLGRLRADDAARRRRFEVAAARQLPAAAVERLATARAAYAQGQGRLLEVLEQAAVASDPARQAELLDEAASVQARIEAAGAPAPISAAPRVRTPSLSAPPLPSGANPDALLATAPPMVPDFGSVPEALRQMADSLEGPIEVFEWVRNEMRPEFYHGLMKGAVQAFQERGGNDADTAAVLVEMLRAKGVPTRFARGVAELRATALVAMTGTANQQEALRVLERAGIPHETVTGPGGVLSVRVHRVWVEAYLPYANYRGAVIDPHGSVWLSLDAAFKSASAPSGLDVATALGFDARQSLEQYLASGEEQAPREFVRAQVTALLATQLPGTRYEDVLNQRGFEPQRLGLLPSTLPYKVVTLAGVSYDLDEELRHRVRLVGEDAEGVLFDFAADSADVVGRRLTLAYEPETDEDAAIVASYGGLHLTPPYLIRVRPVLKAGGLPVAAGARGVGMAVRYSLRLELAAPGGVQSVTNQVQAGNLLAIGLSERVAAAAATGPAVADQILASLASRYFERWNAADDELADLLRVVPVRPTLSACIAQSDIEVEYAGGDPLYPLDFEWKGVLIDADLRSSAPVGLESPASESRFLLLSGLEGSVLEDRVFSQELQVAAVSTALALGLAPGQGLVLHDLRADNVDEVLAGLPFDAAVKDEIRDAALAGLLVRVPSGFVAHLAWRGVAYLLLDEETGESAWQLQGGHSGGVTAPAVIDIPAELRDPLIEQGHSIQPAPEDAQVRSIQKFISTDFQEGTVNYPVRRPLRVLVTDEEGRAVRNANVVFSVMGGGSLLRDPAVGSGPRAEVTVRSNHQGEAEVVQILGTRTDVIPRLLVFPEEPELNPELVGLNLVTARAGTATLSEPFSTFALPDHQAAGGTIQSFFDWMPSAGNSPWPQLSVGSRMGMTVTDQYGNPQSNVLIRFTPRPPPYTQDPPPPNSTIVRPPTDTPAHVLAARDYERCVAQHLQPHYGECEWELPSVLTRSTYLGVFAYPVFGDSQWTDYYYDVATTIEPIGWISHPMPAWVCFRPDISQCPGHEGPSPVWITTGVRPKRVNRLGNFIEAYPLDGQGPFVMWADAFSEEETVEQVTHPDGSIHFMAVGTNHWRRERLTDSEIRLHPDTPGTGILPEIANTQGDGTYVATMRMAVQPQLNKISYAGKHWPLRLAYVEDKYPELDPAHVNQVTLEAERIQFQDDPFLISGHFDLWGITATLTGLNPSPITVGPEGTVAEPSVVTASIEPEAYRRLLLPEDVEFTIRREGHAVLAANGVPGSFVVPVGLPFPGDAHDAVLSVIGVSLSPSAPVYQHVTSEPLDLPGCGLLTLETPYVPIPMAVDFVNATSCAQDGLLKFRLCEPARVTLRVEGTVFEGEILGPGTPAPPVPIENLELPAGRYTIVFPSDYLGPNVLAQKPFVLNATSLLDSRNETAPGVVANSARNRAVLSVGRTFVKGVDLLDGHVVRSHTDLAIPGRHLSLSVQRTYSSAGHDRAGLLGAGWAFSYESRLYVAECGVILQTADGSSQMFRSLDGGQTFVPQKGYHGRLVKNEDLSYDFFDKAGNRHHFAAPNQPLDPTGDRRLVYIEEPHGDRIVLAYDNTPRVVSVREVHPESATPVRQLEIRHVRRGGYDRISSIRAVGLGLTVEYEYDEWGNLKEVRRNGPPLWRERYQYTVVNVRDRHQLLEVTDANGNVTRYEYFQAADQFPGQSGAPLQVHNEEYVRRVIEVAGGTAGNVTTEFTYDLSDVLSLRWQTTVRDGRGVDTRYVLDGNGGDLERREAVGTPLERLTTSQWAETDIFRVRTTDPAGRVTEFGHDASGNLTSEEIHTPDLGVVRRSWVYGPFNRLVSETDAESRSTTWDIDPATGDLLAKTDAAGNMTRYEYGSHGLLLREIDPRGHATVHSDHDSFGNALTLHGPEGRVVLRSFDARGNLVGEEDDQGHLISQEWDGLGRIIERRRVSGSGPGSDEVYAWEYYPGGQKRVETSPLGARTVFTLDGLDRVILERTTFDSEALTIERSYDANGNVLAEKDRRGVRKGWTYDELNRATEMRITEGPASGPLGVVARFEYDEVDRKVAEVDLAGLRSDFEYDGLYRVTRKWLPETCPDGRCFEEYRYDLVGNRTVFRDHGGFAETTVYDGLNRVTSFTDRAGRVRTTEYDDPEGSHVNKSEERDPFGLVTTYAYDELNRETSRVASLTGGGSQGEVYTTATEYDDAVHAIVVTDPRGARTRKELDGLDRVTRVLVDVDGLALETVSTFDGLSNPTTVRDPEQHLTRSLYDTLGRLREVEDALGKRTRHEYDGGGLKTSQTDRRDVRTEMTYDNVGRLLRTAMVASLTAVPWSESIAYQDQARREVKTDARGKVTTLELDGLGRTLRTVDPDGQVMRTEWLGSHDRREQDKRGHWTELRFDGIGRPTLVRDPEPYTSQTVVTAYDDAGNRVIETDRRGIVRLTQRDSLQRLRSVTRAGVLLEEHGYDGNGNRVLTKDGSGRETRFEYDPANRMVTQTDGFGSPDQALASYEHDRDGNVTLERDARAAALGEPFSLRRTYDPLHRLRTVTDGEAHVTEYGHDEEGHRTSITEPGLQVTTFEYGEKGEVTLVRQPAGSTHGAPETRVLHDAARNPLRQTDARGHHVEMAWDDLGRLDRRTQVGAPEGDLVTDPSYDPNGNQTELVDAKGQTVTQTFDELNRLKTKTWAFAPGDPDRPWRYTTSMAYTWDANHNLLRVDEDVAFGR